GFVLPGRPVATPTAGTSRKSSDHSAPRSDARPPDRSDRCAAATAGWGWWMTRACPAWVILRQSGKPTGNSERGEAKTQERGRELSLRAAVQSLPWSNCGILGRTAVGLAHHCRISGNAAMVMHCFG